MKIIEEGDQARNKFKGSTELFSNTQSKRILKEIILDPN